VPIQYATIRDFGYLEEFRGIEANVGVELTFSSAGDANGLIYYLGSDGNTTTFSNPHPTKIVVNQSSTVDGVRLTQNLFDRVNSTAHTHDQTNSWFAFQLVSEHQFSVKHYVLQSRSDSVDRQPRSWTIQGSNNVQANTIADINAATWVNLSTITNNLVFNSTNQYEDFTISPATDYYRWFRIVQTGLNSSGDHYFTLGEWEMYGTLRSI
jgi:hypothetical protein